MIEPLLSAVSAAGFVLAAMSVVAGIEAAIPLRVRGQWNSLHVRPNLALTLITLGSNILLTLPLVIVLVWLERRNLGAVPLLVSSPIAAAAVGVVLLDFAAYVAHVAMHRVPAFWRFHSVHHSDPTVDVTTALRQHPGETLIRYVFMAGCAIGLGVAPATLAIYRAWQAINSLLEHANIRLPAQLDRLLAFVVVSPNMHKVHHSRIEGFTDSNYGNIFSFFDRMLLSFTPPERELAVAYGLDGFDDSMTQRTIGLLALPFTGPVGSRAAVSATQRPA
jgi:sterol desaturase/sphingolipid hydroxylase (fatty acid hydroxylase superfamily)